MIPSTPALLLQGSSLIAAMVHLSLGGFVLLEDPRNRANRLFAFLCLSFFVWSLTYGLFVGATELSTARYWNQVGTLGWATAPALVLHFYLLYTRREPGRLPPWALAAMYLPALVLCAAAVQGPVVASELYATPMGWAERMDSSRALYWLYIVYYSGFCAAALTLLWRWGRASTLMRERWRAWVMFISGAASVGLATLLTYAQPVVADQPMPGLSHFALLVWSVGMVVAVRRWRLLELTPESAAQDVLRGMREAVLLLDERHRVLYANPAAARLLGTDLPGLLGRVLEETSGPELPRIVDGVLGGTISTPGIASEHLLELAGGPQRTVSLRALPMGDEFEQLYGVALVIDDISEQRRLQRRLERADRAAQRERLASVGMLAASVAHEINNPLGYITANLELMDETLRVAGPSLDSSLGARRTAALMSSLEDARQGVERVRNIVCDLRRFTRVEQGASLKPVRITEVVEAALGLASHELKHRARVVRELQALPLVLANEGQLCQVFLNLLINAAHAIPLGQIEGNTVVVRSWEEPEALCVEIHDSGAGIPPDVLPHIFEPFHSTKPSGEGAGLGLPVSLRIMKGMGGGIQAYSEPGQGSRFVVRIPRSVQISEPADEPEAPPLLDCEPADERGDQPVHRLLLVDDEALLLRAMSRLLSPRFTVTTASSGRQAMELLEAGQDFDLIVSDLMMPDLSGMDLFDWLCEHRPQHAERMIFLTGGAMSDESGAFLERFPERSLRKPVSRSTLLSAVGRALAR